MEKISPIENSRKLVPGENKIVADAEEPAVVIPVIVVVVQVGVALGTVPVEIADAPITVKLGNRTCKK